MLISLVSICTHTHRDRYKHTVYTHAWALTHKHRHTNLKHKRIAFENKPELVILALVITTIS